MKLTVQHVDGMRFLATAEGHTVIVDAAREDGGGGTAVSAPQLSMAVVGVCMLEFVTDSCRLREIPFGRLSLKLEYEEMKHPRRVGPLEVTLHSEPEPPDDAKRRLIGVAQQVTLINTLRRPPEMNIYFAEEEGKTYADL